MQKVVAFLEKYAEWVALGISALFLGFVVWSYVLSPDALRVDVGSEKLLPGDVDPAIAATEAKKLQAAVDAPAEIKFPMRDFTKEFELAMGPQRRMMEPQYLVTLSPLPGVPTEMSIGTSQGVPQQQVDALPPVPTPVVHGTPATGNSLVAPPPDLNNDPNAVAAAQPLNPALALANALDKNWVTVEFAVPTKELAAAWEKTFPKPAPDKIPVPDVAKLTYFLQCEVEREEQTSPGKWGNPVKLKPLPLFYAEQFPPPGSDPNEVEAFRVWAEQNQINIAQPPFHTVLKGEQWYIPSVGPAPDPNAPALADASQPFDPANPPNRTLTPQEKQQVYLYNQAIKQEERKQLAEQRKQKMQQASEALKARQGGGSERGGAGGRGGYAPLPIELASGSATGLQTDPRARRPVTPGGAGTAGREGPGPGAYTRPGTTPGANRYDRNAAAVSPERGGGTAATELLQNAIPTTPWDPTKFLPDPNTGKVGDMITWAHDDSVQPGKTYRYRMRLYLKNPLYQTANLTKTEADSKNLAIVSQWSAWTKEVSVPRTAEYFVASASRNIANKIVNSVNVDIFKRDKGDWTKETFTVLPGDSIGGVKNGVDYTTGSTLVDLRTDVRSDVRIITADANGNLDTIHLNASQSDPWYKELKDKIELQKQLQQQANPTDPGVVPNPVPGRNPGGVPERGGGFDRGGTGGYKRPGGGV